MKAHPIISLCLVLVLLLGAFAGCGKESTTVYQVLVTDQTGKPVPGATVQFCSETECVLAVTGDDGLASFEQPAGSYSVHLLKVPEGYAADDTEYPAPTQPGLVTIVLK